MSNLNRSSFVLLRKTKRSFITEFLCTACGHKFRRNLRRIYVGLKRKREAKITLQNLIRQSQQAVVLKKKEEILIQKALEFIYGDLPLDELTPQELDGGA